MLTEPMTPTGYNFVLNHPDIDKGIRSILSGTNADISILFEGLQDERQYYFLSAKDAMNEPLVAHEASTQGQSKPQAGIRATFSDDHESAASKIHAFGSYTKVVIAFAYVRLAEKHGMSIFKSSAENFVHLIRKKEGRQAQSIKLPVKSSISVRDLLLHHEAFPQMNKQLFAPEGTFLFTMDDFLGIDPEFISKYSDGKKRDYEYSNGNYILLAAMLVLGMGKTLSAALNELVFDDLQMKDSSVILPADKGRMVQGFQLSADGTPEKVNRMNLLDDSAESGAMGLQSTLNDIANFNLALLQRIGSDPSPIFAPEKPPNFFFGKDSYSFGGLLSLPAEGVFQSETPIMHLKVPGYEPTPLGKLSTKPTLLERMRALARKLFKPSMKDMTEKIIHKAGYIDGHSSNVIVFHDARAFLIIVANVTGPSDVVHHVSRYLLQEILGLSPQIGPPGQDSKKETEARSPALARLEQSNLLGEHSDQPTKELVGTYRHTHCPLKIVIQADGAVFFQNDAGTRKSSTMRMAFEGDNTSIIRLFIDAKRLPIEGWSVWADLTFRVVNNSGRLELSHEGGRDRYLKL